jgi:tetratricopeptide (TPR) repeat protein
VKRFLVACAVALSPVFPAEAQEVVGKVFSLQGTATIARGSDVKPLAEGDKIQGGEEIQVGDPGRVAVELTDGSYVRLPSGAKMRFPSLGRSLDLIEGSMHFFSHSEQHPTVVTEHVTAAIRGTEFTVTTDKNESSISLMSGSVDAESKYGRAALTAGDGARFAAGKPPETYKLMSSDRSVQWSLFVPFIGGEDALGNAPDVVRALELARKGKRVDALTSLPKASDPCAPENVLRGRLLVANGAPDEGGRLLERCVVEKSASKAHALAESSLALLRLTQGDRVAAESLSRHALEQDPGATSARTTRSFVLQDRGDLDGALAVVRAEGGSGDPDLRAREAELLFMFGYVPEARAMLESLPLRSWYAETVYGFVLMGDRSFDEARAAFETASAAEPAAGLPRVGLGIVSFNQGDLGAAREQFERAAVLEPSRSLYRSYLGKDYFEDDNYDPAYPEYQRAIELDPNDPTPHLYRSFMRLADNNLVGALEDLNAVRELSNKRDVYRSSFLLDEDSAVQAASIGRIYDQLGFRERGRIEAITSIVDDYQNAAAHRLLAQTQEDIFAADIISSELRMANLFAPLSINVVDSIGTSVSLSEYTQLLEKDGWRTAFNNYYDSQGELFRSGILSAHKEGNYVIGLSADGVGQNGLGDDPRTAAGTFALSFQAQPDYGNRLLFEARGTSSSGTDSSESLDALDGYLSAAWLHRFSPEKVLIINSTYDRERTKRNLSYNPDIPESEIEFELTEISGGESFTSQVTNPADQNDDFYQTVTVNEAQFVSDDGPLQSFLTYRNTFATIEAYDTTTTTIDFEGGGSLTVPFESAAPSNINGNSFSYLGDLEVADGLHVNLGGEYEEVSFGRDPRSPPYVTDTIKRSLWSPKAGFVYNPTEAFILRTGYGEGLSKGVLADLTSIEPTLIGGIAQRYNDQPGTEYKTFGVGGDFKLRKTSYIGTEWTKRWVNLESLNSEYELTLDYDSGTASPGVIVNPNTYYTGAQNFLSAYYYEVLTEHWVAGTDYRFTLEDINPSEVQSPYSIRDQRGKAFTRYFFENGIFLQGSSVYRYQHEIDGAVDENARDHVWLFNAGIGYRIRKRHGYLLCEVNNIFAQDVNLNQATYFNDPVFTDPRVQLVANFNF